MECAACLKCIREEAPVSPAAGGSFLMIWDPESCEPPVRSLARPHVSGCKPCPGRRRRFTRPVQAVTPTAHGLRRTAARMSPIPLHLIPENQSLYSHDSGGQERYGPDHLVRTASHVKIHRKDCVPLGQAECPHQKHRHLRPRDRLLGTVVSAAATHGDAFRHQLLDEGGRPVIG